MLWRLYRHYDRLREPHRFLLFLAFLLPAVITATNPYSTIVSVVGWSFLIFVLVTRFWYHYVRPRLARRRRRSSSQEGS